MAVETTTELNTNYTEINENTRMETATSELELENNNPNFNQSSETFQNKNKVCSNQENMVIDPLATLYNNAEISENGTQLEETDEGSKTQSGSGSASKAYRPY
ncbi:856_t:CDS:2 [Ambispora leptoticha]|uniref:856_t:CDS:1 n=1 Tax=Ambispora leptoticha TaxID=144679 RepID=A0A9N9GAB0_9GLOM|nr:856_t:CDS:2 [Ambispora leptoticha]